MERDPFVYAHEREDDIVWMSQNTNQLETSPEILRAMKDALEEGKHNLYPHSDGILGLKEMVLEDLGLQDGFDALITNGGIEGTYTLTRAMLKAGDNVIASDPSFMPIHHQIELCGAEPKEIDIYKDPYKMKVEEVKETVDDDTEMILLIDPLNPLGSSYTKKEVKGISQIAEDNDLLLIHDVTYRDFDYDHTLASEFVPERTVFACSFSKNIGFAGMRLGALVMPDEYSDILHKYRTNVLSANVIAQVGAKKALETKEEWLPDMLEQSRKNQRIIKDAVEEIPDIHLPVFPSSTNMFVIDIEETGLDPQEVQKKLLYEHNVFVRGGNYLSKTAGDKFIRISFTVPEEGVRKFADKLPEVLEEMR
ncbi:MAG: pyridoxal phosphate-dependent aminotransferase [Candidatus Thermoplasmatota archaeon]|nr:pyridoxal phosphate-dependent aminotransferase [Candidatus Thermoplasmatota archaeon]